MSSPRKRPHLRGKTGCLSCRSKRKKCDETLPICKKCSASGRECQWPNSTQMVDRRHASHPRSRHTASPTSLVIHYQSERAAHSQLSNDMEVVVSKHFIEKYYGFLLLPNCHQDFHAGWIRDIMKLMNNNQSLRYSVLANAASHMHNADSNSSMMSLALSYYSKSINSLWTDLMRASDSFLTSSDGCLMSVIFLYLHGCLGNGTYHDILAHLHAARRLIALRLFDRPLTLQTPFEYVALESVLYQIFLTSTGLWTDDTTTADFNLSFWLRAENVLNTTRLVPNECMSVNSPVLGVPVALFRLAIQTKQILQHPDRNQHMIEDVRQAIEEWEGTILTDQKIDPTPNSGTAMQTKNYLESASYLYALIISLLLEQITRNTAGELVARQIPHAVPRNSWQIMKAMAIIKHHQADDDWSSCYIGNWCVYTLGLFLEDSEDIELVRSDMVRCWEATKFMQTPRFLADLEKVWAARIQTSVRYLSK